MRPPIYSHNPSKDAVHPLSALCLNCTLDILYYYSSLFRLCYYLSQKMIFLYDLCLDIIIFEFVRRCLEYLISLYSSCTLLLNYTRCQYCMNHLIYISPILFHEINMMVNKHIFYIFYCSLRLNNKPPTHDFAKTSG